MPGNLFVWNYVKLFSCCNRGNVRVYALIPVQEAFHIDLIANVQSFYGFVNIAVFVAEIRLYCESIGFAVKGNVEVKVISLRTGSIVRVNKNSKTVVRAKAEKFIVENAKAYDRFQFMRQGYYMAVSNFDKSAPVFNEVVGLKDSFNK